MFYWAHKYKNWGQFMDVALNTITTTVPKVKCKEQEPSQELSVILKHLADHAAETVTVKQICDSLGERSLGTFLLFFCLPNLAPLPPGSSAIIGIPLIIIAFQIMAGHQRIWLPHCVANYAFKRQTFQTMIFKINPYLARSETMVKHRYWPLNRCVGDRVFGLFALILAIIVTIPIPLGNWPPAFALAFLAAAYVKKDGIFLTIGTLLGIGSIILAGSMVTAGLLIAMHIF